MFNEMLELIDRIASPPLNVAFPSPLGESYGYEEGGEPTAELVQSSLSGFRGHTRRRVVVEVLTAATGCTLRLRAATPDFEQLAAALQRTVSLACSIDGSGPGLAEANLAAWRLTNLLGEASDTTDQGRRSNLMRRAARQPTLCSTSSPTSATTRPNT